MAIANFNISILSSIPFCFLPPVVHPAIGMCVRAYGMQREMFQGGVDVVYLLGCWCCCWAGPTWRLLLSGLGDESSNLSTVAAFLRRTHATVVPREKSKFIGSSEFPTTMELLFCFDILCYQTPWLLRHSVGNQFRPPFLLCLHTPPPVRHHTLAEGQPPQLPMLDFLCHTGHLKCLSF